MWEVAEVLRRYGAEYLRQYGTAVLPSHRRAFQDILDCRTAALGGQVFTCDHCQHQVYAYHSCRNRSCPKCHGDQTEAWLEERRQELLPVGYFHLVFTLPQELRPVAQLHQRECYDLLMKAAATALIKLAADPRYVGGQVGVLALLHTWTRTLLYHPHVHCLVPAGGVSIHQEWLPARKKYLVPVRALSQIFRGLFRDLFTKILPEVQVPTAVWRQNWVVYAKPALQGPDRVLEYLGRYVHRIALTNSRLLALDEGQVSFRYQKSGETQWQTLTLPAVEFIHRFLQHVLPRGLHKVRYYGLWSPAQQQLLRQLQLLLPAADRSAKPCSVPPRDEPDRRREGTPAPPPPDGQKCPHCGQGTLRWTGRVPRSKRAPP
jgi:hypothetical protein